MCVVLAILRMQDLLPNQLYLQVYSNVSAIGYSGCDLNPDIVTISVADDEDDVDLVRKGEILAFEDTPYLERAEKIMQSKNVIVNIDMDLGDGCATAWGCDLTYDYVKINAEYTT